MKLTSPPVARFDEAVDCYSEALYAAEAMQTSSRRDEAKAHVLYANRSAAFFELGDLEKALDDATDSVKLKPTYVRGLYRKARALAVVPLATQIDVLNSLEKALTGPGPLGAVKLP